MTNIQRDEASRLAELRSIGLLDSLPEDRFDRLTRLARRTFQSAFAVVSFVDDEREWFKSTQGSLVNELARGITPAELVIQSGEPVIIQDITQDARFADWAFETAIKFYAAHPVYSFHGLCLGVIAIADTTPRVFTTADAANLADLAALVEDEVQLQSVANIDDLTQLLNRRGFLGVGEQSIAMCSQMDRPATMMFFDLDGFKQVNDNYGHAEGDRVLQNVGGLMSSAFRNSDVVARLGGDEFCVLLTGANTGDVERPLSNLKASFEQENEKTPYRIDYSVGVVEYTDRHGSIQRMLDEADQRMYSDKSRKRVATPT